MIKGLNDLEKVKLVLDYSKNIKSYNLSLQVEGWKVFLTSSSFKYKYALTEMEVKGRFSKYIFIKGIGGFFINEFIDNQNTGEKEAVDGKEERDAEDHHREEEGKNQCGDPGGQRLAR